MSGLTPSYVVGSTRGCTWAAGKGTLVTPVFLFHTWLLRDRKKEIKIPHDFLPLCVQEQAATGDRLRDSSVSSGAGPDKLVPLSLLGPLTGPAVDDELEVELYGTQLHEQQLETMTFTFLFHREQLLMRRAGCSTSFRRTQCILISEHIMWLIVLSKYSL